MYQHYLKKIISVTLLFLLSFTSSNPLLAQQQIDTNQIKANIQTCIDSVSINPPFTKALATQMLKVSREANYPWGIFMNTMIIGSVIWNESHYQEAAKLHEEALVYCRANHFRHKESVVLANIAKDYLGLGDYHKAIGIYQQALTVAQDIKDTVQIAQALQGIGQTYNRIEYYDETIKYCGQAAALFIAKKKYGLARYSYGNIGAAYMDANKYDSAYRYIWLSLAAYQKAMPGAPAPSDFYMNIAVCYDSLNKKDSATLNYEKALEMSREAGDEIILQSALYHLAMLYDKKGQTTNAIKYYKEALGLTEKYNNLEGNITIATSLAELYASAGDYANAYKYHVKASAANDSFLTKEKVQALAELDTKFKTQQLELRNSELEKKVNGQKYALLRNWFLFYGGLSLAAIAVLAALYYVRKKRYQYRIQNMELEQKQYRAQMNPHFIFNCMNSIQHYIVHNDVMAANKFLSGFATLMRRTIDINAGHFISVLDEMSYLESYLLLEQMRFDGKFTYKLHCDEAIDKAKITLPTMMLQPFAENAIQHGLMYLQDNSGVLTISFKKENSFLICTIDDNGIGREAAGNVKKQSGTAHASQAIALIENKLTVLNNVYKVHARMDMIDKMGTDEKPSGTTVILKFPFTWK